MTLIITFCAIFALVATVLDMLQTIVIAQNPDKFEEINYIIGKHPTVRRVLTYFIAVMVLGAISLWIVILDGYGIQAALFMFLYANFEMYWVYKNRLIGIRIEDIKLRP